MASATTELGESVRRSWHDFWHGQIGEWILTRGLRIALLLIGALLAARFINWVGAARSAAASTPNSARATPWSARESAKHRQAVASVISYVAIALLAVMVAVEVTDILAIPVSSLVAPAAVLGAALGFGAQRIVQDLLSGFFIITEKQYGFGDLVELTLGSSNDAMGTVEDVTLRVTKLRTSEGEMYTIPNGQIMKSLNLSKDWARAVIDIPVPTNADLNKVNEVLHAVCDSAMEDPALKELLLDQPQLMGVESIELDNVNLRMVARTLPGKQFEAGRRLRLLVVAALTRAGIVTSADYSPAGGCVGAPGHRRRSRGRDPGAGAAMKLFPTRKEDRGWPNYIFGRDPHVHRRADHRVHRDLVALRDLSARAAPPAPETQIVPPGFIPDPSYTWVPRTDVQRRATTTTTTPTTTETTTETTSPTRVHLARRITDLADVTRPRRLRRRRRRPRRPGSRRFRVRPARRRRPSPAPGQGPMSTPAAPTQ